MHTMNNSICRKQRDLKLERLIIVDSVPINILIGLISLIHFICQYYVPTSRFVLTWLIKYSAVKSYVATYYKVGQLATQLVKWRRVQLNAQRYKVYLLANFQPSVQLRLYFLKMFDFIDFIKN